MLVREFADTMKQSLLLLYDEREALAIVRSYLSQRLHVAPYQLALMGNDPLPEALQKLFSQDLEQLKNASPLQYVLGETEFYGCRIAVNPSVLIPRPETEELVALAVEQAKIREEGVSLNVWDVGTGSGCIAVALAKRLPQARVFASDVSEAALHTARTNAEDNSVQVKFACHDMTDAEKLPFGECRFDIIVSNPPYIPESGRAQMHGNVLDFEPHGALFVPDDDPLVFYRALAVLGCKCLKREGVILAETYEDFHPQLEKMFSEMGYGRFQSLCDINGRKRMVLAAR
jgi:release factor glutamine methyltransferase